MNKKEIKKLCKKIEKLPQGEELKYKDIDIIGIDTETVIILIETNLIEISKQELIKHIQEEEGK